MKPVSVDEFRNFTYLSGVTFSPDGKTLAFAASTANVDGNKYTSHIYVKRGRKITRLTGGGSERSFRFLDSRTILFPGNREDKKDNPLLTHYYTISLDGGEAEKALTLPIPGSVTPLPGGDYLVEGQTLPGWEDLYTADAALTEKYLKDQKENADYHVIRRNPWWWNGGTYTCGAYSSLYYYSGKTGKLRRLTEVGFDASGAKLTPDGKYIFFFGKPVRPRDRMEEIGLYRMRLADGSMDTVLAPTPDFAPADIVAGEHFLLLAGAVPTHGLNTNPDFYKVDYETLEVSFYAKWSESIGSSVGSDIRYGGGRVMKMVGDTLYFISTIFDSAYLYRLENGSFTRLIDKEGSVDCFDVCGDQIAVNALWDMKGTELYDGNCRQLTHFNDKVLKNKYLALPETLRYERAGQELHGFVLKPKDFAEDKKYPVIFDIHGGPKTVYGPVYYHEMQYWASLGYFVIFCNPTGSDGRGNEFMDIRGKYGTVDYEDLMAFADAALAKYPQMDPENFFETGGSYGGFMTNWIIGHTHRFRACASQRSISNWFSFYGVSDIGVEFSADQCASTPWNNPEKLWEHSPLKYAANAVTPTLFIHSEEDYRCPIDQGYQMFTALLDHGVEARFVQFRGENHDLSRSGKPQHRIRRLKEITDWFENHKG